ncbi:hypothetical protein [Acetobacter sp. DsW_54]|uniref:hypothetical protein n=1 Tax=Acetobacter sp. DsW_54 TaxID=1670660 RepID=UPI0011775FAA|nr:hypothetical protein [Acetobacter sp. DsW_54]
MFKAKRKTEPVPRIDAIKVGEIDTNGKKIKNVFAKHNEYCIFEVEDDNINNQIRVLIDGYSDESERKIQDRFNRVKQKYIEAKGMLPKCSDIEMMKNRIAHTLSTCLNSEETDGNKAFSDLIESIVIEHDNVVMNRIIYLSPCLYICIILFLLSICFFIKYPDSVYFHFILLILSSSLGGSLSIFINAQKLNFEEFRTKKYYFLIGFERIIVSFISGGIIYIAIRSGIIVPVFSQSAFWGTMMILVISGFSEAFVPSILGKYQKDNEKN